MRVRKVSNEKRWHIVIGMSFLLVFIMMSCSSKRDVADDEFYEYDVVCDSSEDNSFDAEPDGVEDYSLPDTAKPKKDVRENVTTRRREEPRESDIEQQRRLERIRRYEIEDQGLGIYDDETDEHIDYEGEEDENNIYDPYKYSVDESDFDIDD